MKEIKIRRIRYSPGCGHMLGEYNNASLEKDSDGKWTYVCRYREHRSAPTVVSTYAVPEEAVSQFAEFIRENRVISLEQRPKSNMFATDYSPWLWSIDYETTSFGKTKRKYCGIGGYKRCSRRDYDLLNTLRERFYALHGEKLSEKTDE